MKNIDTLESILERFRDETGRYIVDSIFLRQALNLYIEEKERLARIDELKHVSGLWYDFYTEDSPTVPKRIEDRIKELEDK